MKRVRRQTAKPLERVSEKHRRLAAEAVARPPAGDDELVDMRYVTGFLRVTRVTVDRWVRANKFAQPIYLTPTTRRWRYGDLKSFIAERAKALD